LTEGQWTPSQRDGWKKLAYADPHRTPLHAADE
jgi:hypothetical protein